MRDDAVARGENQGVPGVRDAEAASRQERPDGRDGSGAVEVRRIRADEWPAYRRLRLESLKDSPLAFVEQYDEAVARPDEFWRERVTRAAIAPTVSMHVAVDGGRLVGKAGCFIDPDIDTYVSAHLVSVYLSPAYRGAGRAESLVRAAIDWALREHAAARVRLFVLETNDRAVAFYRRLGFVPTGGTMAYPPDPRRTEREMEYRPPLR